MDAVCAAALEYFVLAPKVLSGLRSQYLPIRTPRGGRVTLGRAEGFEPKKTAGDESVRGR